MKNATYISQQEVKLLRAGLKARALRAQLAVTYQASQDIIDAMRALRAGIPLPNSSTQNSALPAPENDT